jgi:hypothetical protein
VIFKHNPLQPKLALSVGRECFKQERATGYHRYELCERAKRSERLELRAPRAA